MDGWELLQSNFESFLKLGTAFPILSTNGKTPFMNERLHKSANCLEISFFKRNNILSKVNYLTKNLNWIEKGYDVSYFFFISRLLKYCTTIFIPKIVWTVFLWIFNTFFRSFSYRYKETFKGVSSIIGIGCNITIIKEKYCWYTGGYSF